MSGNKIDDEIRANIFYQNICLVRHLGELMAKTKVVLEDRNLLLSMSKDAYN